MASNSRKIIHVDMDAFYASVEQRDNPDLRGKPIAVGGGSRRGVTTTASYEARKYGVRSAMPGWKAKELCPSIIFVPPRFDAYKEVSSQIRGIFKRYTDLIEPLSLDEAFLDVTANKINSLVATEIAVKILSEIKEETNLTASAGVSYCKFLAKVASDINKPHGITIIKPHQAIAFLEKLPINDFFGVGKVTAAKMKAMGIHTGKDLKRRGKVELMRKFGKSGAFYFDIVRGIDNRPVKPNRVRKSLAVERTLRENLSDIDEIKAFTNDLSKKLIERMERSSYFGKTITLKLKNSDFVIKTRSFSTKHAITTEIEIRQIAIQLIDDNIDLCEDIRLIGLTNSNAIENELPESGQLRFPF